MKRIAYILLCLEGSILSFNVAASSALVPAVALEFNIPAFFAGKIIWLYMLPYGLAALLYGPLVRFFNAKSVELVCFFLFSAANLLAAFSAGINVLFTARILMGLFGASVVPLVLISLANSVEEKSRGRMIGMFFSSTFLASLLGLFLSGMINWRMLFLIPGISGFLLWGMMYLYLPDFKPEHRVFGFNYHRAFKDKRIVLVFTYIFFISLFYHAIQQWLGVYFFSRCNLSQFLISMLLTLTSLSGIFGEAWGGYLSDKIGRIKVMDTGIIMMILSVLALIFKLPVFILGLTMLIWGLGWTFNHAGVSTLLTDLPKEFLNESASLNSGVRFISGGLGAGLGGLIMQKNFSTGFLIFGIGFISLLFLTGKFIRRLSYV